MDTSKIRYTIRNIVFSLCFIAKYSPLYFWMKMLLSVLNSIKGFVERVFVIKVLLDMVDSGKPFNDVLLFMMILLGFTIVLNILDKYVSEYVVPRGKEKLEANMNQVLYKKATALDLSCYDKPEFYNDFVWSISEANPKMNATFEKITNLIYSITTVLLTGALFIALDWLGAVFVGVYIIFSMIMNKRINKLSYTLDSDIVPKKRECDYISRVFYLADYAKEIRLFQMAKRLKKDFQEANAKIKASMKKYNSKIAFLCFVNDFLGGTLFMRGLYLVYIVFLSTVRKTIGFGDIVALFNATERLFFTLSGITWLVPELIKDSMYIERMRKFLEYETVIKSGYLPVPKQPCTIEFVNVSFAYDNEMVLKNVSMTIRPREKIAIVGYNGAGKTTLVKLMMRLYDPTEGEIRFNGVNIKEYDLQEYRCKVGTVFQDFQMFATTLYDNIVMDTTKEKQENVKAALAQSGFKNTFPLETHLTQEFKEDGVNLSGGESQKVAIARAFFKSANIMIFDEPSSALDPISEYNIYNAMSEAAVGKMVIFISHRLSSTKMANKIYMFENGEIIEDGDHNELMYKNGKYAEMFKMQAEKYQSVY